MEYNIVLSARGAGKYEAYKKLWMDLIRDEIEEAEKAQNNIDITASRLYYKGYEDGLRYALEVLGGGINAAL